MSAGSLMHRQSAKLAVWQKVLLIASGLCLFLSGIGWLLLHHYGQITGPFGPEPNPFEPWFLRAHGLVLIPALLGFGSLFVAHMPKGWRFEKHRIVAVLLTTVVAILIASGYLLYYVGDDIAREWTSKIHWIVGLGLPVVFVWHYIGRTTKKRGEGKKLDL